MSLTDSGAQLTMPVMPAGYGGGSGFGGFGGDGWWIVLLLLWGNNGWGGNGGMNGGVGSEVQRGFDHSTTITKLDGITTGIADATYALNNAMMTGFHGVDSALCNLGYQTQAGFNALAAQLAQCCCENREAVANSTQAILGKLSQMEFNDLNTKYQNAMARVQALESQNYVAAALDANTAEILRRTGHDCPTSAYIVQPPTPVSFNNCGTGFAGYGYGCAGGCAA